MNRITLLLTAAAATTTAAAIGMILLARLEKPSTEQDEFDNSNVASSSTVLTAQQRATATPLDDRIHTTTRSRTAYRRDYGTHEHGLEADHSEHAEGNKRRLWEKAGTNHDTSKSKGIYRLRKNTNAGTDAHTSSIDEAIESDFPGPEPYNLPPRDRHLQQQLQTQAPPSSEPKVTILAPADGREINADDFVFRCRIDFGEGDVWKDAMITYVIENYSYDYVRCRAR